MSNWSKRGFALPVAVFALVVVGVLVTGGFYMARQETRIGVASKLGATAFYLAEGGANDVMANWDASAYSAVSAWGTTTVVDTVDQGIRTVEITRMTPRLFFLYATGTVTEGGALLSGATRSVGMILRLNTADILPPAALTTIGSLKLGGSSYVIGNDSIPGGWGGECAGTSSTNKPGVMIDDTANIEFVGTSWGMEGNPAQEQNPGLTADSLLTFGELHWDDLVRLAEMIYPTKQTGEIEPDSILIGGVWRCNTHLDNWGDPLNPDGVCGTHFPVIYAATDLDLTGGKYNAGQGILLVENDLKVAGNFQFFGPVIVKGTLSTSGTGGHFNGGVIAANVDLDLTTVIGDALVQYSTCAVTRAILNNSSLTRARPLENRSWVDLSSVIQD
jgi:hypothetical protein